MKKNRTSPFLEKVRIASRVHHYSVRTERAYVDWVRRFILFHGKRYPAKLGTVAVTAFIIYLAVGRNVASTTQDQALNAPKSLYRNVLGETLECPMAGFAPNRQCDCQSYSRRPRVVDFCSTLVVKLD